jgi:hypothetical protein
LHECGNGRVTWCYADSAASALALDPRERDIEQARLRTPRSLRGRVTFEFLAQHASVDAWLAYREQQETTGKLGDEVIARARTLLGKSPGVIVVRERSRALILVRT